MSINALTTSSNGNFHLRTGGEGEVFYPETDQAIMPAEILHFLLSVRLTSMLLAFFASRADAKVFGNIMLYYEEGFPQKSISPDLMICFGLEELPTSVYKLWETKVVPSVVIELALETTWFDDVSNKLAIYQKLGVREYYVYDIERAWLPAPLMAYRLDEGVLTEVEIVDRRVLSESLGLELVETGERLRLFDPGTNKFLMTPEEMAAKLAGIEQGNAQGE